MTVKRKINHAIENFIDKGAAVKANKNNSFKSVLIRIPTKILNDLDSFLEKKPWLKRTRWIVEAINDKLKSDIYEEK